MICFIGECGCVCVRLRGLGLKVGPWISFNEVWDMEMTVGPGWDMRWGCTICETTRDNYFDYCDISGYFWAHYFDCK